MFVMQRPIKKLVLREVDGIVILSPQISCNSLYKMISYFLTGLTLVLLETEFFKNESNLKRISTKINFSKKKKRVPFKISKQSRLFYNIKTKYFIEYFSNDLFKTFFIETQLLFSLITLNL
jgi:hypothetical protein